MRAKTGAEVSKLRKLARRCGNWLAGAVVVCVASAGAWAQISVTTAHNDIARTGANTNETILTPANVNSTSFGKLFSASVDGYVYAQPLYLPNIKMGSGTAQAGTTHNVVFIATQHDSVYAFDADSNAGANGSPLWHVTMLDAAHGAGSGATTVPNGDVGTGDIVPEIGITGTPVIDPSTNTLYVVSKSKENGAYYARLHALDVTTGLEKFGGPVTLTGSVTGTGNGSSGGVLTFDTLWENQRPGLLLLNGIVYVGFAAHGDNGPWHGWILAYNASNLSQTGAWCSSPNAIGSGFWNGGAGLAADVPSGKPYGRIFAASGNGTFDAAPTYTTAMDYGDSILNLDLTNGVPKVTDAFTPYNQASLNGSDQDQGSGGVVVLPDAVGGGSGQHQLVQVGKSGSIYVLNRESLGGYNPNNTKDPGDVAVVNGGLWGSPAYWNGNVYIWGKSGYLDAFGFANGTFTSASPTSQGSTYAGTYSPTPSVSANGTTNGIVWSLKTDNFNATAPNNKAVLYAHNATNVSEELYDSTQSPTTVRDDTPGQSVKFTVPTVVNGKVYVGTANQISVYGLLSGLTNAATPVITPASESFTSSIQVSISDSTSGATIYYTTDGSTPTTNSNKYSGPFTVSSTETITAAAIATGYLQSTSATQTYTLSTQVLAPIFSPSPTNYTTTQTVTITDATPGSTIYYTTDGSTPVAGGGGTTKVYSSGITVSSTTTIQALATASGLTTSSVTTGLYTIASPGTTINFSSGFSTAQSTMTFNGSTDLDDTRLQLTNGAADEAGSAFNNTPVNIQGFTTDFTFQLSNAGADGITFTIQNQGPTALGPYGGGLGYGPDTPGAAPGIQPSVAIKFDTYSNQGEGPNSTGLYINGVSPTIPAIDLTPSGINLHSGSTFATHITYDGTTLAMTLTDPVSGSVFTNSWTINIPATVGGNTAYVGFTGGTGGETSSQKIGSWTFYSTSALPATATPTFNPAAGTYLGTQTVTISDATSGATIYYTTNGTTPTTSSTKYTGPITVTASETIEAIAVASGLATSATATAAYAIESQVPTPTFSPAAGTYTGSVTVSLSAQSGATIYYTTNGTTPTASSTKYTGPITVSATQTIQAIATASGFFNSNVASATYTITSGGSTVVSLGSGFTAGTMTLNGSALLSGTRLRLTDGGTNEAASAWYETPVNIQQFTTNFSFQITGGTSPTADGFAFVIQSGANSAIGPYGGGLGYGPFTLNGAGGIPNSVAVKFDLYSNNGEGTDSTGLYTGGASPTTPAVDMTSSGVNLHSTDVFNAQIIYDGTNLTMTITDTTTNATFTNVWAVNIPSAVGGNTALVGFTGGTGGDTAIQEIIGWTMSSGVQSAAATPTFSPAAGTYTSVQTVTINDATSGATIYYTTNGTTPTTSSTKYTGPISVSSTTSIQAIAVASGDTQSAVATAAYTINLPAINYSSGFTSSGLAFNGSAQLNGTRLRLTDTGTYEAGSAWSTSQVNVQQFSSDFTFQLTSASADGFAFVIQNTGVGALGPVGGGLGYGPDNTTNPTASANAPIAKSVAVKFDLYSNAGEGTNSTGMYIDGASPTVPATTIGGGVNLQSGDVMRVHVNYDGTTLTMTITDTTNTADTFTASWPINIPSTVGANAAWVGFTGGTGGETAIQEILTWSFSSTASKTPLVYKTMALTAVSSGPTFRQFTYAGFPDGTGTILDATAVGDNVTFTVNVPTAGTYDVMLSFKDFNTRGISQMSINGTNVGATVDQYVAADAYGTNDYGKYTFATAGNYSFKFTITGKNSASAGYSISFDDLTLTPQ